MIFRRVKKKIDDDGVFELVRRGVETGIEPRLLAMKVATDTRIRYRDRTALATRQDTDVLTFGERESHTLSAPPSSPFEMERMAGTSSLEQPFVCRLSTARLVGTDALAVDSDGSFLLETSLARRDQLEKSLLSNPSILRRAIRRPKKVGLVNSERNLDTVCSLVDGCSGGYSHWVLKALPRLEGVRFWENRTGERVSILVPVNAPDWVFESLEFFGYETDRILSWTGEPTFVEDLIVPSVRSPEQKRSAYAQQFVYDLTYKLVSENGCRWLRTQARRQSASGSEEDSNLEPAPADRGRRVVVSRADANRRRVVNGEELRSALLSSGFEWYTLSSLSFADQVRLFIEADIVVSPHGAGLANLVFASECAVLELFGSKIKPTYWMLANTLDLEYDFQVCEPVERDMKVDADRVRQRVRNFIE